MTLIASAPTSTRPDAARPEPTFPPQDVQLLRRLGLEGTTLYGPVQHHAASFIAHIEASTGAELPRFIKDKFDAFLECGILAHSFLRQRCAGCGHDKLLTLRGAMPQETNFKQTLCAEIDGFSLHAGVLLNANG